MAGNLPAPASAGGVDSPGVQPPLRGSYCEGPGQDLAPPARAGCAHINGYIAAGAHFGSDERVDGRPDAFAPLDQPGMGVSRGLTIVGAPLVGNAILAPTDPGDTAR